MTSSSINQLIHSRARFIKDFPKEGINFVDIFPLVEDPDVLDLIVSAFAIQNKTVKVTRVVALEARGFVFGPLLAKALGVGFVPIRKPGKLPPPVISEKATTEYSEVTLEMTQGVLTANDRVIIVDDILATGGTAKAAARLVQACGAVVAGFSFLGDIKEVSDIKALETIAPVQVLVSF